MAEREELATSQKIGNLIEKNKVKFIVCLIVVACALAGYITTYAIYNSLKNKNLSRIDEITFTLTDKSGSLEESELEARSNTAIEQLAPFTKKNGIAGARANMICAEIAFQQKKYQESADFWKAAAKKAKKSYIAPIAYFNIGVCYEQLNNIDAAAENYKIAADNKSFVIKNHAKFSYGRVLEAQGKYAEAVSVFTEINDSNPDDSLAKLAKSRIIALKVQGKVE